MDTDGKVLCYYHFLYNVIYEGCSYPIRLLVLGLDEIIPLCWDRDLCNFVISVEVLRLLPVLFFVLGHGYSRTFASLPTPTPTQEKVYYYVPHIKIHYYGGIEVRWHRGDMENYLKYRYYYVRTQ